MMLVCAISLEGICLIDRSACKRVSWLNGLEGEISWLHVIVQVTIGRLVLACCYGIRPREMMEQASETAPGQTRPWIVTHSLIL